MSFASPQRTSNPNFLSTVSFRKSDGLDANTQVRLAVYDVRERVTNTTTQLGQATVSMKENYFNKGRLKSEIVPKYLCKDLLSVFNILFELTPERP